MVLRVGSTVIVIKVKGEQGLIFDRTVETVNTSNAIQLKTTTVS